MALLLHVISGVSFNLQRVLISACVSQLRLLASGVAGGSHSALHVSAISSFTCMSSYASCYHHRGCDTAAACGAAAAVCAMVTVGVAAYQLPGWRSEAVFVSASAPCCSRQALSWQACRLNFSRSMIDQIEGGI
jgi:hypothetical protein